jgi:hypothetical protein
LRRVNADHAAGAGLCRIAAVVIGCACALAVGFLFDKSSNAFNLLRKDGGKKSGTSE